MQCVYIIAPKTIKATLDGDNGDEDEVNDVNGMVLKRSTGNRVVKATDAEKKDRAMHHLYARKATEWLTVTGEIIYVNFVYLRNCCLFLSIGI